MPELPDLQAFSQNLQKRITNKKILDVHLISKKANVTAEELKHTIHGQTIKSVYREGKELRLKFSNDVILGLHLMLHGQLHVTPSDEAVKFSMMELVMEDDLKFTMSDFQKQARPTLNPVHNETPDALSAEINYKFLKAVLAKKKAVIKNVLLDQSIIRGIGNAYADEILWDAKISPFSHSNKIPEDAIKKLGHSIKKVLEGAIKEILEAEPDIISGEVRDFLKIHQTRIPASPTGKPIEIRKTGARKTYFTAEQVLYEI